MKLPRLVPVLAALASTLFAEEPKELSSLRESYLNARSEALAPIEKKYSDALEAMKTRFTKAGDLEAALSVDAELKQLTSPPPLRQLDEPVGMPTPEQAPARTVVRGDYEYILVDAKVTWEEARAECQKMGGELASFESQQDWERIARLLVPPVGDPAVWIGAFRPVDQEGPWEWYDGSPFPKKVEIGFADQLQRNAIRAGVEDGRFTADASRFKRGFLCKKKK